MIRRGVFLLAWSGSAVLLLATLVRLTVRDRFIVSGALFYAAPWPVIAVGAALLVGFWFYEKRCVPSGLHALLAAAALAMWWDGSWRWRPRPTERGDLRVVLWNVSRPTRGLPAVARWLRAQDADVIALAEGHRNGESSLDRWQHELPGYAVMELRAEMTCLVRGKIIRRAPRSATSLNYALLQAEIRGQPLTILQVDLHASIFRSRRRALDELAAVAHPLRGENLIVLGDFNTPRESALLDPLRADLTPAFEAAGCGLGDTWPMPLPVLCLDQIWSSRGLPAMFCRSAFSLRSDHRAVVADFRFAPPDGRPREQPLRREQPVGGDAVELIKAEDGFLD